jgi:hypothetical protein
VDLLILGAKLLVHILDPITLIFAIALYLGTEELLGPRPTKLLTPLLAALTTLVGVIVLWSRRYEPGLHVPLAWPLWLIWLAAMCQQWAYVGARALFRRKPAA